MKTLKRIFPYVLICLLLLTTFILYKTASNYRNQYDRYLDWSSYIIVRRFDKQSDYLYILSEMVKDPSTPPGEIVGFIDGINVFAQDDDFMAGVCDIVFHGEVPDYIASMRQVFHITEEEFSAMSTEERDAFVDICLELSALYDRHNAENSISWYLFEKDYDNPALVSLSNQASALTDQICH